MDSDASSLRGWTVTAHLMPPTVARSSSFDAVVEHMARQLGGDWSAEPLETALADIRFQQPTMGGRAGWTTYHPPGYRITLSLVAADENAATDLARELLGPPDGWLVDPQIDARPAS